MSCVTLSCSSRKHHYRCCKGWNAEDDVAAGDDDAAAEFNDADAGVEGDGGDGGGNALIPGALNMMTGMRVKWTMEEQVTVGMLCRLG